MEGLRNNTVRYVPGVLKISKALILSPEDYDKLAEDISPEYPFLKDKKYGLDVSDFSFERVCQLCSGLEPQAQRRFLSDAKQAAYAVERIVRRRLREMELSVTPEADYSVEQKAAVKEGGQPKLGKVKKTAQPERE